MQIYEKISMRYGYILFEEIIIAKIVFSDGDMGGFKQFGEGGVLSLSLSLFFMVKE